MSVRIESCRRGGFTIKTDQSYEELLDLVKAEEISLLTETAHLAIAEIEGIKVSIRDDGLTVKSEDRSDAEMVKEILFE